jgi:hypothetical protein
MKKEIEKELAKGDRVSVVADLNKYLNQLTDREMIKLCNYIASQGGTRTLSTCNYSWNPLREML